MSEYVFCIAIVSCALPWLVSICGCIVRAGAGGGGAAGRGLLYSRRWRVVLSWRRRNEQQGVEGSFYVLFLIPPMTGCQGYSRRKR